MFEVLGESGAVLVAMALLSALSALLAGSETAIFNLGPSDFATAGSGAAAGASRIERTLRGFMNGRHSLLVTILFANLLVNLAYFNLAALVAHRLRDVGFGFPAVGFSVFSIVAFLLVADVAPKLIAVRRPRRFAEFAAMPLRAIELILFVPRVLLSGFTGGVARLLLGSRRAEGDIEPEELQELLGVAAGAGHLEPDECERLQSILVLSRMEVREIMTPRVSVVAFRLPGDRESLLDLVAQHRFNKIPVYRESLDKVEGFLDVKEVLSDENQPLERHVRECSFVPGSAKVAQVMDRFQTGEGRVMVVVDEYGGTEGLITQEDLVESVVGDLSDEGDLPNPELLHLGPGHFSVDADMGISTWGRLVGRDVRELSVNTVGGLVMALLDRLPRAGDKARLGRVELEVVAMKGRRASRVVIRLLPPLKEQGR